MARPGSGLATEKALIMAATKKDGLTRHLSSVEQGPNSNIATDANSSAPQDRDQVATETQSQSPNTRTYTVRIGYRGHRIGSKKEQAHRLFDELGAVAAKPLVLKLGVAKSSVNSWFREFKAAQFPPVIGGGDAA